MSLEPPYVELKFEKGRVRVMYNSIEIRNLDASVPVKNLPEQIAALMGVRMPLIATEKDGAPAYVGDHVVNMDDSPASLRRKAVELFVAADEIEARHRVVAAEAAAARREKEADELRRDRDLAAQEVTGSPWSSWRCLDESQKRVAEKFVRLIQANRKLQASVDG